MSKYPRTRHYCLNKSCGWEEISYKLREGLKCPKCNGPTMNERIIKSKLVIESSSPQVEKKKI